MPKKASPKGKAAIDFTEYYDAEDDIYYVTFKTGEPSHVMEMDDVFLVEVGMFSNLPTGFRILNFKKSKIAGVQFFIRKVKKAFSSSHHRLESLFQSRERELEHSLEKVLA